jgi:hypothetical protein
MDENSRWNSVADQFANRFRQEGTPIKTIFSRNEERIIVTLNGHQVHGDLRLWCKREAAAKRGETKGANPPDTYHQ